MRPEANVAREAPSVPARGILIGYAGCSAEKQGVTAQRQILRLFGVAEDRIYFDHGLNGCLREAP
jgi:hypothetical protein